MQYQLIKLVRNIRSKFKSIAAAGDGLLREQAFITSPTFWRMK